MAGRAAVPRRRTRRVSRSATRPGHNTPMLVLYGSNLGTAEELATRMADLAEINGFATQARRRSTITSASCRRRAAC